MEINAKFEVEELHEVTTNYQSNRPANLVLNVTFNRHQLGKLLCECLKYYGATELNEILSQQYEIEIIDKI